MSEREPFDEAVRAYRAWVHGEVADPYATRRRVLERVATRPSAVRRIAVPVLAALLLGLVTPTAWAWVTGRLPDLVDQAVRMLPFGDPSRPRVKRSEPPTHAEPRTEADPVPSVGGEDPSMRETRLDGPAPGPLHLLEDGPERPGPPHLFEGGPARGPPLLFEDGPARTKPDETEGGRGSPHRTAGSKTDGDAPSRRVVPPDPERASASAPRPAKDDKPQSPPGTQTSEARGQGASALDPIEQARFEAAHRAHFGAADRVRVLEAWDLYLERYPRGRYEPEARYNRALTLIRLGRYLEARRALEPFEAGAYGGIRKSEAKRLLDALPIGDRSRGRAP